MREVNRGALWFWTFLMAALLVTGAFISYDKGAAQMFALLGGISLPLFSLLHEAGRGQSSAGSGANFQLSAHRTGCMAFDTRTLTVDRSTSTAHRLHHYDGVCGNVHGHNMRWDVELTVSMEAVGDDNMPLDFKLVSDRIDKYDHATLLNEDDPLLDQGMEWAESYLGQVISFDGDPTCELVAQVLADDLVDNLDCILEATVTVHETEKYGMTGHADT